MEVCAFLFSAMMLFAGVQCLQWSDKLREDVGPIEVCAGDNIQLLWNFTLDSGERVKAMVWTCQPEGKQDDVLATFVDSHFVPMARYSGRLAHLKDGGLEVSCATIQESGNYSIAISTESQDNVLTVHRKTVSVLVVDAPKTQSGQIYVVRKPKAVRDVTSGEFHVMLSCGNFSDRGHPAVDVMWTTPTGEQVSSSSFEDGFFHLQVSNPPVGGNYCCSIPPSLPAARCLAAKSPLLDPACVDLKETEARFALLEARYAMLEARHSVVETLQKDLNSINSSLHSSMQEMDNKFDALEIRIDNATDATPVHFQAKLKSNISPSSGSILELTDVISNQGDTYDPSTGYFRAPVDGSYVFMATTGTYAIGKWSNLSIKKEGTVVARTNQYMQSGSDYNMATCHAALLLKAGQRVWLESESNTNYFYSHNTYFTGFRIM